MDSIIFHLIYIYIYIIIFSHFIFGIEVIYMRVLEKAKTFIMKISPVQKAAFWSTVVWGIITHLAVFSAGLMYHDGLYYSGLGSTYTSGRWLLGVINDVGSNCLGIYQLPYLNGFITILFLAVSVMLITSVLKVRTKFSGALIGAILVSFPSVASLFSYMFTAPAYSLSLLMSIIAVYLVNEKRTLPRIAAGACFMCMSLGIYQAYLAFAAPLALIVVICDGLREQDTDVKALFKKGIIFIITLLFGLILYLLINNAFVAIKDISLTSYQGINKMGQASFEEIITAVRFAYSQCFSCKWLGIISSVFMQRLSQIVEILTVLLFVYALFQSRAALKKCIFLSVLFLLVPLAINSIYLIQAHSIVKVHSLMRYALVFTYIFPVILIDIVPWDVNIRKVENAFCTASLAIIILVPLCYTYRDNTAYLSASTTQQQTVLYLNSLVTRIRCMDGYSDELPVAYIGKSINDDTIDRLPSYDRIYTFNLYQSVTEILVPAMKQDRLKTYLSLHLAFSPQVITDTEEIEESDEFKTMPCYPDSGSIKIIDDVIVVKFSEPD